MRNWLKYFFVISVVLLLTGCKFNIPKTGNVVLDYDDEGMIKKISELPPIDNSTILTKENYQEIFSKFNFLIDLLNKEGKFDFQKIEPSLESFEKLDKEVTRYTPLLNNYNEVIYSAKYYESNKVSKNDFYKTSLRFGFELTLVITAVFYGAVYGGVGILYRGLGINRLAFTCPSCISYALSTAYWSATTYLVENSSKVANWLYEKLNIFLNSEGGIEGISTKLKTNIQNADVYVSQQVEKIKNSV